MKGGKEGKECLGKTEQDSLKNKISLNLWTGDIFHETIYTVNNVFLI